MPHDTVYLIEPGSSGPVGAAITREAAREWAAGHYTYPVTIVGVPLVGPLPGVRGTGRDPVKHWEPGLTFKEAVAGVARGRTRDLYEEIWSVLLGTPLADHGLRSKTWAYADEFGWSDSAIRSRRAELTRAGWVFPAERRNGRTVWQSRAES
jgi:hypothetical protein